MKVEIEDLVKFVSSLKEEKTDSRFFKYLLHPLFTLVVPDVPIFKDELEVYPGEEYQAMLFPMVAADGEVSGGMVFIVDNDYYLGVMDKEALFDGKPWNIKTLDGEVLPGTEFRNYLPDMEEIYAKEQSLHKEFKKMKMEGFLGSLLDTPSDKVSRMISFSEVIDVCRRGEDSELIKNGTVQKLPGFMAQVPEGRKVNGEESRTLEVWVYTKTYPEEMFFAKLSDGSFIYCNAKRCAHLSHTPWSFKEVKTGQIISCKDYLNSLK